MGCGLGDLRCVGFGFGSRRACPFGLSGTRLLNRRRTTTTTTKQNIPQVIESELGVPFDQVFELVEEDPIAAASIGQVYKAVLRSTGEEVAVKVRTYVRR